jgi:branched-chain amino acid aminotransferase
MATLHHGSAVQHPIISLNGRFISSNNSPLSPLDRGFTFGDGVFETMKVVDSVVWYLDRHLARLSHGAARLGIVVPAEIRQWIDQVLQETRSLTSYGLRITLTRGPTQTHGLAGHNGQEPTLAITTFDLPKRQHASYEYGLHVLIASFRRYEHGPTIGIKTTNYLESILALREAVAAGYDEAIFLDTRGFVSEASASNIFLWSDSRLVTPARTCGILPGITRAIVLELATRAGIPTAEQEVPEDNLYQAEELFLTSSLREIVPVIQVNGCLIGTGAPGSITQQLTTHYNAVIERV